MSNQFLIKVIDTGHTYRAQLMTVSGVGSSVKATSTAGYQHAALALVRKLQVAPLVEPAPVMYELAEKSEFKAMRYYTLTMTEATA